MWTSKGREMFSNVSLSTISLSQLSILWAPIEDQIIHNVIENILVVEATYPLILSNLTL